MCDVRYAHAQSVDTLYSLESFSLIFIDLSRMGFTASRHFTLQRLTRVYGARIHKVSQVEHSTTQPLFSLLPCVESSVQPMELKSINGYVKNQL